MTLAEGVLGSVLAVLGGGGVWNWIASRGKTKVDLIQLAASISSETIKALKEDRKELLGRIDHLDALIENLKHDVRGLSQHIVSLETLLAKAGIEPPPRPTKKTSA